MRVHLARGTRAKLAEDVPGGVKHTPLLETELTNSPISLVGRLNQPPRLGNWRMGLDVGGTRRRAPRGTDDAASVLVVGFEVRVATVISVILSIVINVIV